MTASREVLIANRRGLHARASAKFVTLAAAQPISVTVAKGGSEVTGTSIMGLMMLGAAMGDLHLCALFGRSESLTRKRIVAQIDLALRTFGFIAE